MDYTNLKEKMEKSISVYQEKLSEVRAGRANPAILNKIKINLWKYCIFVLKNIWKNKI